jgi:putative thiamine transport system ATP-binding protein
MSLVLENVTVRLGGAALIKPFSLSITAGEVVTLMGPSGCGKSSLLSHIAGDLDLPLGGQGKITVNGQDVAGIAPEARRIGRLFQDDLLFPHLSVGDNLLFGMARGERLSRVDRMRASLADIELEGFEQRSPQTLSGGQRARVALMRALLAEPLAMLLDEPFNKLDRELRLAIRKLTFVKLVRIPCLMVTHDREDAPPGGRVLRVGRDGEVADA